MKSKHLVIYSNTIPKVGGVETAVYNLAKVLFKKGIKITIVYITAEDYRSLFHYAEVADIKKLLPNDVIKCDVCLVSSNYPLPSQIKAKKYLQWIHSDYSRYNLNWHNNKIDQYVAVSEHSANVIQQLYKVKPIVIYNLLDEDFGKNLPKKRLKLVTNARVSKEKGFERMLILAKLLKEYEIPFKWTVYGDNTQNPKYYEEAREKLRDVEEVQFVGYKSNVTIGLEDADYLVQLSDWEGCPYSVLEALKLNIPCIITDYAGARELINDGENGYVLSLDMKNIDVRKIVNEIPKFKSKPFASVDQWIKLLETK